MPTGSATPCIPGRKMRNKAVKYDKRRYKHRNRIEIMFGRVKDWRHGLPIASSVAQSMQPTARHHRLFASIVVRNSSRERTVSLMAAKQTKMDVRARAHRL